MGSPTFSLPPAVGHSLPAAHGPFSPTVSASPTPLPVLAEGPPVSERQRPRKGQRRSADGIPSAWHGHVIGPRERAAPRARGTRARGVGSRERPGRGGASPTHVPRAKKSDGSGVAEPA